MNNWILKVELDGEWEECSFPTPKEALSAFAALVEDYQHNVSRAVLCSQSTIARQRNDWTKAALRYVN